MRYILVTALLCAVSVGTAAEKKEWYSGGTLHKKTGAAWVQASAEDRLATAADFASTMKKPKSMAEMKVRATELMVCIDKSLERQIAE